jgi:hypothetical protein
VLYSDNIFGENAVSDAGLRGHQAHLCNNPKPNLELTVNGPDRPLRFGAMSVAPAKKSRSGRCGLP